MTEKKKKGLAGLKERLGVGDVEIPTNSFGVVDLGKFFQNYQEAKEKGMNQERGIEVRCVKCGWEGWSGEAPEKRWRGDGTWKKCCPTCGEGPLRAMQVAKVESALHE